MNPVILVDSRLNDGTPTTTDTASGDYNVLNLRDLREFTLWKAASAGTKYITVDCGSAKSADALGIFCHNLYTAGASVSVESSPDNAVWTERLAAFTPSDDQAKLKTFSSVSARYWRVKIVTASVAPQMAVLLLGTRMTFPYPPEAPFSPIEESIECENVTSKTGVLIGAVVRFKPITLSAKFNWLTRAWVEGTFETWWRTYGSELSPFLYAPDLDTWAEYVYFVRVSPGHTDSRPVSVGAYYDSVSLKMEGTREE